MEHGLEIIKFEILSNSSLGNMTHTDIKLFFCLQGEMQITCEDRVSYLKKEGTMVVNARDKHSYIVKKGSFGAVFYISSVYIGKITSTVHLRFACDSSKPPQYDYEQLRGLLRKILAIHNFHRWKERILEEGCQRQVISIMLNNYAVWEESDKEYQDETERTRAIIEYIQNHYNQQIRLQDLAEQLHLTVPYLSKYIKQNLKAGFTDYLNSIRISHAIDDLNLTDHSVTRIAYDNGFFSLTSFNRVFRDALQMTPSEFRKQNSRRGRETIRREDQKQNDLLQQYLKENPITEKDGEIQNDIECQVNVQETREYGRVWEKVWNLGTAADLLLADVQEQVLLMRRELGIKRIRIWGIFSESMMLWPGYGETLNFSMLDRVFDFLLQNRMIPFVDLGFHPKELYRGGQVLVYQEQRLGYGCPKEYIGVLDQFIRHYLKRYGEDTMGMWEFEIPKDDRLFLYGGPEYFKLFESASDCIKSRLPSVKVGGGAIFAYDNLEIFESFVSGWMQRTCMPDFISLWLYPYELHGEDGQHKDLRISGNPNYCCEKLNRAQKILKKYQAPFSLYVTEWDVTISCRNFLNESCYRAVYLLKNLVACMEDVELMSCSGSLDMQCEYYDSALPLNGGFGLLTKNGIKKPAFYAFTFLNRMGKYLLAKGEHYLITADAHGGYAILLFHCCRMEMEYYYEQQDTITAEEVEGLFQEGTVHLSIRLEHIKNGPYLIKESLMGPQTGSVLNEWKRLGYKQYLEPDEIQYMKSICMPRLKYHTAEIRDDSFSIQETLSVNELKLVQIIPCY